MFILKINKLINKSNEDYCRLKLRRIMKLEKRNNTVIKISNVGAKVRLFFE